MCQHAVWGVTACVRAAGTVPPDRVPSRVLMESPSRLSFCHCIKKLKPVFCLFSLIHSLLAGCASHLYHYLNALSFCLECWGEMSGSHHSLTELSQRFLSLVR